MTMRRAWVFAVSLLMFFCRVDIAPHRVFATGALEFLLGVVFGATNKVHPARLLARYITLGGLFE